MFEIERKFLVEYPDIIILTNSEKIEIIQTYLKSNNPENEIRIRRKKISEQYEYTYTEKKTISGIKRIETEKVVTRDEYELLLKNADKTVNQIKKVRYGFRYKNQYFELDTYEFWQDRAIMEIELENDNQTVEIPDFIKVIKEVTNDKNYKNRSLANLKIM